MQLAYTAESNVGPLGSNALFKPKLIAETEKKAERAVIPNYDGANQQAPAAFFIGQTSPAEQHSGVRG